MQLCGLEITTPVGNAAGPLSKTLDDVQALAATKAGITTVGSITPQSRSGNPEPRWFDGGSFTLNSFGLPNAGLEQYLAWLPQMIQVAHTANKPLSVSVAGFELGDYLQLVQTLDALDIDLIELNLSCPNAGNHQLLCFQPELMQGLFEQLSQLTDKPLLAKLSPYSNPAELDTAARLINAQSNIQGIVCCNSFPNGFYANSSLEQQVGGVGGQALLPIALGQVKQFRNLLNPDKVIVGVGGVQSAADVQLYVDAGANFVQTASHLVRHGHAAINHLVD